MSKPPSIQPESIQPPPKPPEFRVENGLLKYDGKEFRVRRKDGTQIRNDELLEKIARLMNKHVNVEGFKGRMEHHVSQQTGERLRITINKGEILIWKEGKSEHIQKEEDLSLEPHFGQIVENLDAYR